MGGPQRVDDEQGAGAPADPPEMLFFIHIPKCAGSSFRNVLKRWCGRDALFIDARSPEELALGLEGREQPPLAVAGHFRFGIHAGLSCRPRYVSLVRDPLDRFVSLYQHMASVTDHPFHATAASMDLERFYEHCLSDPRLRGQTVGVQCHFLTRERTFEAARPVIDSAYSVLAPTELYAGFVAACGRLIDRAPPGAHVARNVARKSPRIEEAKQRLAERIAQDHGEDVLLYEYVRDRFAAQLAKAAHGTGVGGGLG
jgi:hypothetical protein